MILGLVHVMAGLGEASSLGFSVREYKDMASTGSYHDDRISSLSGNSEGFRSAFDSPGALHRRRKALRIVAA